ncbi:pyrimidine/purine nucleoside phosphorylase [Vibrio aestuarianus]|uniref:Pyrimidine/purine nucleoside phosphorylase n=1 Tax=Vibrio aestuarianus TaxID=28171 RepID=A0A7X6S6N1_9VIBR|nr:MULTISPECIES: pyrimidine/purine nucleoside phosphorylase [Vibrio]MDE1209706.1 pyrimidine/purine nucleoside phosphorylase [Vibrio aestuarianus]MDE1221940.1 pyrimidine/purine nucleoside phosphorylase [Vibrio aestuarianus]MDE1224336.1 pyrimidine/purine nucleoside phosphorylase [Vibrio aestuarianus]MDE1231311.1 pyrimidine/purine nucleoside phosphorylase [Vibrio aestuarianus]MDE1235217.1 pyrimidine/purine nucleoside phosphorylase [Vibrio aestuarianus]
MIKENSYFEGNVKSLGFTQQDGDSSVGVMAPGEYTFGTAAPERMTVVKGTLVIKRIGDEEWSTFNSGESFEVAGNSSFDLQVAQSTAYLCEYL